MEFRQFLDTIDARVPAELDVHIMHIMLDSYEHLLRWRASGAVSIGAAQCRDVSIQRMMQPVAYELAADYDLHASVVGVETHRTGTGVVSLQNVSDPDRF